MFARPSNRSYLLAGVVAACCATGIVPEARAAHPLATEDPGTQGTGKFEVELGWQRIRDGNARSMELGAQLSYGVTDALDVIVRPTLLDVRGTEEAANGPVRGLGDALIGFKWRFFDGHPVNAGVRADVFAPTGSESRGLGFGAPSYHAVATVGAALSGQWHVYGNLGYNRVPATMELRRDLVSASAAAVWSATDALRFSLELIAASPAQTDVSQWSLATRAGMIASVSHWLDLDVGYQARLNRAGPHAIALAGATARW